MQGGEYYLYCGSTSQRSTVSLEYFDDWFSTGIIPRGFIPASLTTTTSSTPTTIPHRTDTPTTITPFPTPSPDGGLAAPAIAGIGVAVGAVVVGAIAALVICLLMRKRKRKEGANQPEKVSTGPSDPPMQQGNPGQEWQTGAPVSSSYPNSQTAFLKGPEQPSPPYSSEPASLYKPHSSSISSPVTPYDSNGRTGSTGQYPLSQNSSAIPSPNNTIPPSFMLPVHRPGELPKFSNSPDHTAQPPSPISAIGHDGGGTSLGNPIENQLHEMSTGFPLHNNPRGSGTSQSLPYHDVSSSVASPTRGNSGSQSPPPLHPIHEAPQAYYGENQAHGMVPSPTSRQSGPGAYYEGTYPPHEFPAGEGGGRHSHSNSVSSIPPLQSMSPPTPATTTIVAPTPRNNSGTFEGQQQAQYNIHEAPATSYTAYSPEASAATRGPLEVYHNHNAQWLSFSLSGLGRQEGQQGTLVECIYSSAWVRKREEGQIHLFCLPTSFHPSIHSGVHNRISFIFFPPFSRLSLPPF